MNRVICIKGHFYDGDKYAACPHCAEGVAAIEPDHFSVAKGAEQEEPEGKKQKKGFFKKKEAKQEAVPAPKEDKTAMYSEKEAEAIVSGTHSAKLVSTKKQEAEPAVPVSAAPQPAGSPSVPQPAVPPQQAALVSQPAASAPKAAAIPQPSLSAAFSKVSAPAASAPDEGKTIGFFSTGQASEPPVGYLMCVAGEDFGIGFPLKSGNNAIGRSQSMDVVIMDAKVSREKQAYIMYEPYKREFYVKPGESAGLCYFNDEVVLAPTKMQAFDQILLGDTRLMLFPICCDRFSWEDYAKK